VLKLQELPGKKAGCNRSRLVGCAVRTVIHVLVIFAREFRLWILEKHDIFFL
jgi:hypothetical protein